MSDQTPQHHKDAEVDDRVAIWSQDIGSIDLYFVYPKKRASDPMVRAIVEAVCKVWKCD